MANSSGVVGVLRALLPADPDHFRRTLARVAERLGAFAYQSRTSTPAPQADARTPMIDPSALMLRTIPTTRTVH